MRRFTSAQKEMVKDSYPSVAELSGPIALLFYGRLFERDPQLRPMFRADIHLQARKLMDMLASVIGHLDHFEQLAPVLKALGQKHVGYGVRPEHYDRLTSALLWALGRTLDDFDPELKAAWKAVIESVSEVMKAGAAEVASRPA